jgi:protein O-mannosyl-transferase
VSSAKTTGMPAGGASDSNPGDRSKGVLMRRELWIGGALALLTVGVYWPVRQCEFVNYDDPLYVSANAHVLPGLTWPGVQWAFTTGWTGNWHPLTWISHMADCQWYHLQPAGHHLTNVLLHVANTLLLFGVLRGMTGALWRSALVAALFAWHPMHVESVAWVAERKDVLSTLLGLLTLSAYGWYVRACRSRAGQSAGRQEAGGGSAGKLGYGLAVVCFGLGLMAKPMLVSLPLVMLLLDYWPMGRVGSLPWGRSQLKAWGPLVWEKVPFLALALVSSVVTFRVQQGGGNVVPLSVAPLDVRLGNVLVAYVRYAEKLLWPRGLSVFYPLARPWPTEWVVAAGLGLLSSAVAVAWWGRRRPYLLVGCLWFAGMLVPVIGLVHVGSQAMANRYAYLPSVGLFITVIWGAGDLAARWPRCKPALVLAAGAGLAASLGCVRSELGYWKNSMSLFERSLAIDPENPVAQCNLAQALMESGRYEEGVTHVSQALQITPNFAPAEALLAWGLLQQGRGAEAIPHYRQALRLDPRLPEAFSNLAWILATDPDERNRDGPEAVRLAERACELTDYENPLCWTSLGAAYAETGRYQEAVKADIKARDLALARGDAVYAENTRKFLELHQARRAFHSQRDPVELECEAARQLAGKGAVADAIIHYRQALHLNPNSLAALNNLAWIRATDAQTQNRNGIEAIGLAERACELTHYKEPFLLGTLAAARAEAGQYAKAIEAATEAHRLFQNLGNDNLARTNENLLRLYEAHQPYHASAKPGLSH